jgi:hypothetical protein
MYIVRDNILDIFYKSLDIFSIRLIISVNLISITFLFRLTNKNTFGY